MIDKLDSHYAEDKTKEIIFIMEKSVQELEHLVRSKMALCDAIHTACQNEHRSMSEGEKETFKNNTDEIEGYLSEIEYQRLQGRISNSNSTGIPKPQLGVRSSSSGPFKTFGEYLQSVYRASNNSLPVDEKLYKVRDASGLGEVVPSSGGFACRKISQVQF